jgi:uncharacterized membrane protein (UPF0182 family)
LVIAVLAIGIVLLFSLKSLATIWTDSMWFSSEGYHSVWWQLLATKIGLFASFGAAFALALFINLLICDRLGIKEPVSFADDELVSKFQEVVHPIAGRIYSVVSVILGLLAASGTIGQWQNWVLFSHARNFGIADPQFRRDVGFYIFRLPFLQFCIRWTFLSLLGVLFISAIAHYLNGGIRVRPGDLRVMPAVKAHLSVLLALIAITKAVGYVMARYALATSRSGYVEGAGYTDVHVRIPALNLLVFASLFAAAVLLWNIRQRGWTLPVLAVGVWGFVAIVIGVIYPAAFQTFKVNPAQSSLEKTLITRNIAATRHAYSMDKVKTTPFIGNSAPSTTEVAAASPTLANMRLWDPSPNVSLQTFNKLQGLRAYYTFTTLGVDRYKLQGKMTPTLLGVRQLNPADIPNTSWVNSHLQYTHGTGAALAPANQVASNGNPAFAISDVPPVSTNGAPVLKQSGIYFGVDDPGYVVANSKQTEVDYQSPQSGTSVENHYVGKGGVQLSSLAKRAAFALRLNDFNLLISNLITPKSRIIAVRDVRDMVNKAAPFLSYDSEIYGTVVGGHLKWVIDGYTTSSAYPFSQDIATQQTPPGSTMPASYNYARNSVKAVVDAYTGSLNFYVNDPSDPIIQAYETAFPSLFSSLNQASPELRAHLRYPADLFGAQSAIYGRYHTTSPTGFYNSSDTWMISPTSGAGAPDQALAVTQTTTPQGFISGSTLSRMSPLAQVMALPGSSEQVFTWTEAMVPTSSGQIQNLAAFLTVASDGPDRGKIKAYITPRGQSVLGPVQADAEIQQSSKVSRIITPLDQHGSNVLLGNLLMVPVGHTMLYARPLYVSSAGNPLPQLKYLITVLDQKVAIAQDLASALADVLGQGASLPPSQGGASGGGSNAKATVNSLLAKASDAYDAAQVALKAGNLAEYQRQIQIMGTAIADAKKLVSSTSSTTGASNKPKSTTTTTKPSTKQ